MKQNELSIEIDRPAAEVFEFAINPQNTHKWIDSIIMEETNTWPVKLGTLYRNRRVVPGKPDFSELNEYEMVKFEPHKLFEIKKKNNPCHVRYTFTPLGENRTKLTFLVWMDDNSDLSGPFAQAHLDKLKSVIENGYAPDKTQPQRLMVELTRFKMKRGKSEKVQELVKHIRESVPRQKEAFKAEKMFVESIFYEKRGEDEYLYWYNIQGEGASHLLQSQDPDDKKYIELCNECFDKEAPDSRVDMKLEMSMIRDELRE